MSDGEGNRTKLYYADSLPIHRQIAGTPEGTMAHVGIAIPFPVA